MRLIFVVLTFLIAWEAYAQNRSFLAFEHKGNLARVKVNDGEYQIKFVSRQIVETAFLPLSETVQPASHIVDDQAGVQFEVRDAAGEIWLNTATARVKIVKSPFQIAYFNQETPLLAEKRGYTKLDSTHQISLAISADETLYGGGARVLGMNRRGHKLPLFNKAHYGYETQAPQMNFCVPVFLSSKRYMVHFDNPTTGFLDLDSRRINEVDFEFYSGRKVYQVVMGDSWEALIANYTGLTGRQPLPPIWALGNFSSRFGYHSQEEVMKTVAAFEAEKIPVDAIILDLYWFGKEIKGALGNLSWYKDSFPDGPKMIRDLRRQGVKTILITEPFVLTTSSNWKNAVSNDVLVKDPLGMPATWDFYFGNTGLIDVYKEEGKKWFWNVYKNMILEGVAGQWGDLGEPEALPRYAWSARGKSDEFRNIYGHQWAKIIFEGYARDFPDQRPFILMRSGYSGSQKYGMIPWSGDVNRSWGGLQGQVELSLQMGMQGLAYMHSDLGGFGGDYSDDELYVRWLQYGVFQPVFRPHAQESVPSEPVFKDGWAQRMAKQAIDLRYKLWPYNYDLAMQNAMHGTPLMRPLFFEEPDNSQLYDFDKGYMWGGQFLIYPVKQKGQAYMKVYFPKSSDWIDFYTGKKFKGGANQKIGLTPDHIPTFVKSGSFIPMTKWIKSTDDYRTESLEIHFFHDDKLKNASGKFSFDDGLSPGAIEKNQYATMHCSYVGGSKSMTFNFRRQLGTGLDITIEKPMQIEFCLHRVPKKPKSVLVNGRPVIARFDSEKKQLTLPFTCDTTDVGVQLIW